MGRRGHRAPDDGRGSLVGFARRRPALGRCLSPPREPRAGAVRRARAHDPRHAGRRADGGREDEPPGYRLPGRAVPAPPRALAAAPRRARAGAAETLVASTAARPARSSIAAMNIRLPWFAFELACAISWRTTRAKCRGESSTERLTTMFGESHTPSVS